MVHIIGFGLELPDEQILLFGFRNQLLILLRKIGGKAEGFGERFGNIVFSIENDPQ